MSTATSRRTPVRAMTVPYHQIFRSRHVKTATILGVLLLLSPPVPASLSTEPPQAAAPSFLIGERLVFDIRWSGLSVGQGVLEVSPGDRLGDRDVLRLTSTAASNSLISFFFPVKDRIESVIDAEGLYSYRITIDQRHGRRKRYREIVFDQNRHEAVMTYKGRQSRFEVPPQVQDSLSCLYYFRAIPKLETDTSVFIDVHESKKNWKLEIQVLGRETLNTVLGKVPTVKVKAIVLYEGVLWDKGDLYLWLTDDARRIPVMMRGKIVIGSITATLTQVEPQQLVPAP